MKRYNKFYVIALLMLLVLLPTVVQAVSFWPLVPCGLNAQPKDSSGVELPKVPTQENPDAHDYTLPCNQCDLFRLFKNIIDFVLMGLMPPLAMIFFIWGGFLILMGGANPSLISQGKTIFWNTVMGVAIISASWLITNTIIRSIGVETVTQNGVVTNVASEWWKFECRVGTAVSPTPTVSVTPTSIITPTPTGSVTPTPIVTPTPSSSVTPTPSSIPATLSITTTSLPNAIQGQAYSETLAGTGGQPPYRWAVSSGSLPAGLTLNQTTGVISGTPTTAGTINFQILLREEPATTRSSTRNLSIVVGTSANTVIYGTCSGVACTRDTTNVCRAVDPGDGCNLTAVNSLNASIVSGVGNRTICAGIDTVKMLKTIIANESDGRIDIGSGDGQSAGPFQLTPATANRYKSFCGVTQDIDFNWLRNADTVDEQACIAAEFIRSFVGTCGCDVRQIAAGYNGGPTACAASNACGQQAAANGGQCSACNVERPTRKWECLWEDTQHSSCNIDRTGGGYSHTRIYAPRVEYCYNRF